MRQEDDKWWMYGVRPAAIAESGETIEEAFSRFRNSYKEVLFDLAQQIIRFDDFKTAVEQFFYETDEDGEDERLWEEALRVRATNCTPPEPFAKLPREAPEMPKKCAPGHTITRRKPSDGSTHWSCRKLASVLGVSKDAVHRVWQVAGLKPHRLERYMARNDPEFETKAAADIPPRKPPLICSICSAQYRHRSRSRQNRRPPRQPRVRGLFARALIGL